MRKRPGLDHRCSGRNSTRDYGCGTWARPRCIKDDPKEGPLHDTRSYCSTKLSKSFSARLRKIPLPLRVCHLDHTHKHMDRLFSTMEIELPELTIEFKWLSQGKCGGSTRRSTDLQQTVASVLRMAPQDRFQPLCLRLAPSRMLNSQTRLGPWCSFCQCGRNFELKLGEEQKKTMKSANEGVEEQSTQVQVAAN